MVDIQNMIGLDFETYGSVDLTVHGLERYCSDKFFRPLIASTSYYPRLASNLMGKTRQRFDFTSAPQAEAFDLKNLLDRFEFIVAHNAGFERRVLQTMGIDLPASRFIDSAVVARAAGAAGKLEACAPQLLDHDKLASGWDLIKLFSIPSAENKELGIREWDDTLPARHPAEWDQFAVYCDLDADLGLDIVAQYGADGVMSDAEYQFQAVTMEMNQLGWPVDVDKVEEMQRRYLENVEVQVSQFREDFDARELNLNSLKQLKEWCLDRGIKATSFDEKNVAKLRTRILKRIEDSASGVRPLTSEKYFAYHEVVALCEVKQALGGSSLKKLRVILDTVGDDGRLRDQYLHIGAGQTRRTTGRSVQMQNLKRLPVPADMQELDDPGSEWNNEKLAENIRQVFTSGDPQGFLIVGDFSSIESRGLAWLAGAEWKLEAYRQGKDMYKVMAESMFNVAYDRVVKDQRQAGKVGELSCGYQASAPAVQAFAEGMGITMTEAEATRLVSDWRTTNPETLALWAALDLLLHRAFTAGYSSVNVGADFTAMMSRIKTPASLERQHPGAVSMELQLKDSTGGVFLRRVFHGCYERGRGLCYYKPTERKTGDVWTNHFTDPKTKQVKFYNIYGGKLAGILTQSLCRELFFRTLLQTSKWAALHPTIDLIGQFHDEIVLDWRPGGISLDDAKKDLGVLMTNNHGLKGFPVDADIKHDYRYTK